MLTFDLKDESFGDIDTRAVAEGGRKWSNIIEAEGMLYASPEETNQILVVDLRTRKASGIEAWRGFNSVARHGMYLYFAPGTAAEIMLLHLETRQIRRFRAAVRPGIGYHFTSALVANDKLFALPDREDEVLILDLKPNEIPAADPDAKIK